MQKNQMKEKLEEGKIVIGSWAHMGSPEVIEAMGYAGFDFVIIDRQHTFYDLDEVEQMFRAADTVDITPIIRVADKNPSRIMKALDAGVKGILVPGVSTKEEAQQAVEAGKYPPLGIRSACPVSRATEHGTLNWEKFVKWSNENTMIWLLVEGPEGVANFEDIIQVKGVDAIVMGPFDLSQSLGFPGQTDHPEVVQHLRHMTEVAGRAGVDMVAVIFETEPERIRQSAQEWINLGCRVIAVGNDLSMISEGCRNIVGELSKIKGV